MEYIIFGVNLFTILFWLNKRKKGNDDDDGDRIYKNAIADVVGDFQVLEGDADSVKDILTYGGFSVDEWLGKLPLDKVLKLKETADAREKAGGLNDLGIRAFSKQWAMIERLDKVSGFILYFLDFLFFTLFFGTSMIVILKLVWLSY